MNDKLRRKLEKSSRWRLLLIYVLVRALKCWDPEPYPERLMSETRRAYIRQVRRAEAWRRSRVAVLAILALLAWWLSSCSPLTAMATPTAAPTVTETVFLAGEKITPTPRPSCRVDGETVYLRPDPSKAGAPLAILRAGQILEVLERGAWLKVTTRNTTGFIYSAYCR
jgi:hypothetical protein